MPSTSFVTVVEIHNVDLNNQRQWCLPHLLLWWGEIHNVDVPAASH